jgi:dTDP-4-dehydrorhamnose reductase
MSADEYFADKFSALRPTHSALALDKLSASGFVIRGWPDALAEFLRRY